METCYSHNEEDFHSDMETALELAVEDFLGCSPDFEGETEIEIFEGDQQNHTISEFLPPYLSQDIAERAYEVADEWGGEWGDSLKGKEIQEILSATLENWANLTDNQPDFWSVKNIRPINVKIKVDKDGEWEIV